jgi:tRNA (guanine-N7-)-methyltransferase
VTRPARAPLAEIQPYWLEVPHPRYLHPDALPRTPTPIDWPALFGNTHPVEVEVGFGKARFLLDSAQARPAVNFLGIEIERKYAMETAARVARLALGNVRLSCTEALWFFRTFVADRSVAAVHVYFPDPWWKRKHKKRKLFTAEFAKETARILRADGVLHFATDVHDYYTQTLEMLREQAIFIESPDPVAETIATNFERKYREEGRAIYRTRFELNHGRTRDTV